MTSALMENDWTDGLGGTTGNGSARLSRSSGDRLAIFLILTIIFAGRLETWLFVLEQPIVLRLEATTKLVCDLLASATQHNTEARRRQVLI